MNMPLVLLNRRRRGNVFTPSGLFALAEPGVWYDPSDVANLNWRRNLLTFTEQFDNAAWTKSSGVTVSANTDSAPDSTTTADTVTSGGNEISQSATCTVSTVYTDSVYFKKTSGAAYQPSLYLLFTGGTTVVYAARLNTDTGAATAISAGGFTAPSAVTVTEAGSYWRLSVSGSSSNNTSVTLRIYANMNSGGGTGAGTQVIWGAQLELGSVATDYQRITDVNTEVLERFPTATLFQDTAGTTPVTTPGQTVALALDKSKGLVLGSEIVVNGNFATDTDWVKTTGWTISGGAANYDGTNNTNTISQTAAVLASGRLYRVSLTVTLTQGALVVRPQFNSATGQYNITSSGTYSILLEGIGGSFGVLAGFSGSRFIGSVDNISVRELPGNHATQATAASRPTYGIVPRTGRRNLLTRTEEFNVSPWVPQVGTTITANTNVAPDGTTTADTITTTNGSEITQTVTVVNGANYRVSLSIAKTSGATTFPMVALNGSASFGQVILNTNTGVASVRSGVTGATSVAVTDQTTFWRVAFTFAPDTTNAQLKIYPAASTNGTSFTGSLSGSCVIWGAQLETGSSATAYQRVGSAFDVTEAGVPSLSYLSFDGVDDFLVTPTITPGIDKAQVFAGVRKLSDAAAGILLESSINAGGNSGALYVVTGPDLIAANRYSSATRGSGAFATSNVATTNSGNAPDQAVLSTTHDIAGDLTTIRRNGVAGTSATVDLGTGNFLAYPIYIGRRAGTSAPFNGQLYSMIVRFGTNLDAGTITSTETWVNQRTGAF